ncbi:MAG: prenyltransferase/squalene oxidase repeat-containing protein, partial [Saprospiraceae bacterium]
MKKAFSFPLLLVYMLVLTACQKKEKTLEDTFKKSVEWMWAQQSEDGGWHSKTHAVLRDGKVLTPYILFYLLKTPDFNTKKEQIEKATAFIERSMHESIGHDSSSLEDYPNYSAAYALRVLHQLHRDSSIRKMIAHYLIDQQFDTSRGFEQAHLVYGGWGYGEKLGHGVHGHVDVSHTRRVLEALVESEFMNDDIREATLLFLSAAQHRKEDQRYLDSCSIQKMNFDGGFISSPVTLETNKSVPVAID